MRLAIIVASIALIAGGGLSVHYATSPDTSEDAFAAQYLSLAQRNPDAIIQHLSGAISGCLPEKDRLQAADPMVQQLGAKTFLKSMALMAENKSAEQMSGELISFVINETEGLSAKQQENFIALTNNGLRDQYTLFCVMSVIKMSIDQGLDIAVSDRQLRL